MRDRYIIVDDIYSDPDGLIEAALESIKQAELPRGNYAGVMTTHPFLGEQHRALFQQLTMERSSTAPQMRTAKSDLLCRKTPLNFTFTMMWI